MNSQRQNCRMIFRYNHFLIWLLIFTFFLPAPLAGIAAPAHNQNLLLAEVAGWNRHIHERLNSAERRAAIAEAAKREAEMAKAAPAIAQPAATKVQRPEASANALAANEEKALAPRLREGDGNADRPQSVGEVLFNQAASFMGVPGLTPQRDKYGNYDEGLGFHQDGTVRKAGGTTASGPSDRGQRAQAYMRSGLQGGAGQYGGSGYGGYGGYASTIWEPGYDPATGIHWRGDPTSGGRISAWSGQSRNLDGFDPFGMAIDKGLSYGAGLLNSAGEAAISSLVDNGRARLNFMMDKDGYFSGEGDALLPWYDSKHTTIYTQLGARSMHDSSDTRWIGNFGLGQRWFPFATGEDIKSGDYDAGNLMFGYNAFFDYDLTREHQRGGLGLETQYDWLRLAANYYFPISDWKGSEDFDSRFVEERPAEGWDLRAKGYLPFYRNIAITGAYSQWYGDHVGMFGYKELEKDPRVWSYGLEYTPIPLVSGFITQKSTERGRTDTEFGLNFTYHFNMPWEDQISHAKVAELRSVGGSRHEFVDRENRIILEYRAKSNFNIEYIGKSGANIFRFRIINGFGEFLAGQTVHVSAGGGVNLAAAPAPEENASLFAQALNFLDELVSVSTAFAAGSVTKITDSRGEFDVTITSPITGQITLTARIGDKEASVTVGVDASSAISVSVGAFTGGISTATLKLNAFDSLGNPVTGENVTWTILSSSSSAAAVTPLFKSSLAGLDLDGQGPLMPTVPAFGDPPAPGTVPAVTPVTQDISSSVTLTDIVGQRTVTVQATVLIDGSAQTFTATVSFGNGPLSAFRFPDGNAPGSAAWADVSGPAWTIDTATELPAAKLCGNDVLKATFAAWTGPHDYSSDTGLPTQDELRTVATGSGNGAWLAAGWPVDGYWTGELFNASGARVVLVGSVGVGFLGTLASACRVVCRR